MPSRLARSVPCWRLLTFASVWVSSLTCRQRHLKCTISPRSQLPNASQDGFSLASYARFRNVLTQSFFFFFSGDKTGIECLRCQRSGRRCIPAPAKPEEITFRHGQNPSLRAKGPPRYGESDLTFPDDQTWVETPLEGPLYAFVSSLPRIPGGGGGGAKNGRGEKAPKCSVDQY